MDKKVVDGQERMDRWEQTGGEVPSVNTDIQSEICYSRSDLNNYQFIHSFTQDMN